MKRTTRKPRSLAGLACVVLLASGLAACGGSESDDGDVTLRMTVWTGDEAQLKMFNDIADDFMAEHPEVTDISFDTVPFEGYTTALTTQVSGSNPPDLAWILERDAPDFVASGALADIAPTLEETPDYDYGDLTSSATELWKADDKLYAYPFSTSPLGVFFNKDLLKKAGVSDMPDRLAAKGQWTWENAERIAAKVAVESDATGIVVRDWDYQNWINLAAVWRGFGAQAWSEDGKTCGFDSPEMNQAMTFLHDAIFEDAAMPAPGTTADFFAGESGMTITQISRASLLEGDPFSWGIVPLPSGPDGDAQVIGQAGVGVIAKGANAEAAAEFLAYFSNPENSTKLAQYFPPARESLLNANTLAKANPRFTKEQLDSVVVNGIKTGTVLPSHTDSAEITNKVQAALDPMWKADADVSSVLKEVCTVIEPSLS